MLLPDVRQTLVDALRPPAGYALDIAVGTSFSLNLDAALTPATAFAVSAISTDRDKSTSLEPLELLDAIRRNSKRITIFFQSGQVPIADGRRLFAFLEGSLVPVTAPNGGVFHPKVWVVRYSSGHGDLSYRVLCTSRNLTHDRSWDTLLRLDSLPPNEKSPVRPGGLAKFVKALPSLAVNGVNSDRREAIAELAEELKKVRWSPPESVQEARFVPIGIGGSRKLPFPEAPDRLAVISPFVGATFLDRLPRARSRSVLISAAEQIDACASSVIDNFGDDVWVLDADATGSDDDFKSDTSSSSEDPAVPLRGLHAKVFVTDKGSSTTILTGSANATSAAFKKNVEFMAELVGPKRRFGVEQLLAESDSRRKTLSNFLTRYPPDEDAVNPPEGMGEIDVLRLRIASTPVEARAVATGDDNFSLGFASKERHDLPGGAIWKAWPLSLPATSAQEVSGASPLDLAFNVTFPSITSFLANEIQLGKEKTRFVLCANLIEAPRDREAKMLRQILENSERLVRYLLMLLTDERDDIFTQLELLSAIDGAGSGNWRDGLESLPLLEVMLRALARDPKRLLDVHRLMSDLREVAEDDAGFDKHGLLDKLESIWDPIWQAAEELQP